MKRNAAKGGVVLLAAVLAIPLVIGVVDAKPQPEAMIIAPSSLTVDHGEIVVIRGALIKGKGKDLKMDLFVTPDTKLIGATVLSTSHRGNVVSSEVVFKAATKRRGASVSGTVTVSMRAAGDTKKGEKYIDTKTINVTVVDNRSTTK